MTVFQFHSVYDVYSVCKMKKVAVSDRIPQEHANQLEAIMEETGKCESEIVREAIALKWRALRVLGAP